MRVTKIASITYLKGVIDLFNNSIIKYRDSVTYLRERERERRERERE